MSHNNRITIKNIRIKSKKDIAGILACGTKKNFCYYSIVYKKNTYNTDRCAVLVKKKLGKAVVRNRFKRVFREIFRLTEVTNQPYFDILLFPHRINGITTKTLFNIYKKWREQLKNC